MEKNIEFIFLSLDEWNKLRHYKVAGMPGACLCIYKYETRHNSFGDIEFTGDKSKTWLLSINQDSSLMYVGPTTDLETTVKDMQKYFKLRYIYVIDCPNDVRKQIEISEVTAQDALNILKQTYNL